MPSFRSGWAKELKLQRLYRSMVALSLASGMSFALADDYPIGLEQVYQSALSVSNEYRAIQQEALSNEALYEAEEKYFMPKVSLNGEWNKYYGSETPDPSTSDALKLNVDIKLWGTGVADRTSAAYNNRTATSLLVTGTELSVYQTVLRYLAKIERTRQYLAENEAISERLNLFVQRQRVASNEGSSAISDLKEAELEQSRYRDSVSRIRTSIDQMFRSLREETNYHATNPDQVGLSTVTLAQLLTEDISLVDVSTILQNNVELQNRQRLLDAQLYSAHAQRERFSVSLVNETQMEVFGDDDWDSGDIKSDSYVGLKATYDLFNFQNNKSQKSAYYLYEAENERVNLLKEQLSSQLNSLQEEFLDTKDKRESLLEQITLNEELVAAQERELLINKLEYVDIVKSLASLNESYITLLNYDLTLTDSVVDILALNSQRLGFND